MNFSRSHLLRVLTSLTLFFYACQYDLPDSKTWMRNQPYTKISFASTHLKAFEEIEMPLSWGESDDPTQLKSIDFDLDGDGTVDSTWEPTAAEPVPIAKAVFLEPGDFEAKLKLHLQDGSESEASTPLRVEKPSFTGFFFNLRKQVLKEGNLRAGKTYRFSELSQSWVLAKGASELLLLKITLGKYAALIQRLNQTLATSTAIQTSGTTWTHRQDLFVQVREILKMEGTLRQGGFFRPALRDLYQNTQENGSALSDTQEKHQYFPQIRRGNEGWITGTLSIASQLLAEEIQRQKRVYNRSPCEAHETPEKDSTLTLSTDMDRELFCKAQTRLASLDLTEFSELTRSITGELSESRVDLFDSTSKQLALAAHDLILSDFGINPYFNALHSEPWSRNLSFSSRVKELSTKRETYLSILSKLNSSLASYSSESLAFSNEASLISKALGESVSDTPEFECLHPLAKTWKALKEAHREELPAFSAVVTLLGDFTLESLRTLNSTQGGSGFPLQPRTGTLGSELTKISKERETLLEDGEIHAWMDLQTWDETFEALEAALSINFETVSPCPTSESTLSSTESSFTVEGASR